MLGFAYALIAARAKSIIEWNAFARSAFAACSAGMALRQTADIILIVCAFGLGSLRFYHPKPRALRVGMHVSRLRVLQPASAPSGGGGTPSRAMRVVAMIS